MEPKESKIVTTAPFYNIIFGCSNKAFYQVQSKLWEIANEVDIELGDGYITEECDFEGDLDKITIYRQERAEEFITAVLKYYNITDKIPDDMYIILSIFEL